jgi:hypothetical protein
MQKNQLQIGWSNVSITPDRPIVIDGQLYSRVSSYVHDPIYATALAIEKGDEQCIMVSLDMVGIDPPYVTKIQNAVDGVEGIDAQKITISATHTHNSSRFSTDMFREIFKHYIGGDVVFQMETPSDMMPPEEAEAFFLEKITHIILTAWRNRKPGGISYAADYAAVGFNRRPVFSLGEGVEESKMYGDCSQDTFLRFEGSVDHTIDMIYTWDQERNLTGVVVDVPCPSQVYELHRFITADYWGPARDQIRTKLGNIHILSICGAAGDQNPLDLVRLSKINKQELIDWNAQVGEVFRNINMEEECELIGARITEAVVRGYGKAKNYIQTDPVFKHTTFSLELPIRKVSEADYKEALQVIAETKSKFSPEKRMTSADQVSLFEPIGIVQRWEQQQEREKYAFQANIMRLGAIAITTNPFELFVDYGLRIRARCKADQVCICQLTNGVGGYLPTNAAIAGGSYSSKPASTVVGPKSGDELVERVIKEINALW